jgi:ribose transport system substrate-binding protein
MGGELSSVGEGRNCAFLLRAIVYHPGIHSSNPFRKMNLHRISSSFPRFSMLLALGAVGLLSGCSKKEGGADGSGGETAGKFTIIDTKTDGADRVQAKANAENTLVRYPDVSGLVGLWAYNAPACLEAVKSADKVGKVKIFSFDEDEAVLQGIIDGAVEGTVVQQPYEFGYQSVKYLKEIADGKTPEIPENKLVTIPVKTIVKDTAEAYWAKLKELQAIGKQAESAPKPVSDQRFAFVINNPDPFWSYAQAGCFKAEQDFGVICDFQAPPTGSQAEQNRILEDILSKGGYKGVAVSPLDPANQTSILNKVAAEMPLICHDSDAPESNRLFYLGTSNYDAGRELGKLVKERMPDGGKLMIFVGSIDVLNAQERRRGLIDELKAE